MYGVIHHGARKESDGPVRGGEADRAHLEVGRLCALLREKGVYHTAGDAIHLLQRADAVARWPVGLRMELARHIVAGIEQAREQYGNNVGSDLWSGLLATCRLITGEGIDLLLSDELWRCGPHVRAHLCRAVASVWRSSALPIRYAEVMRLWDKHSTHQALEIKGVLCLALAGTDGRDRSDVIRNCSANRIS